MRSLPDRIVLQSPARSTLDFPGKDESDIPLAECGCVIPTRQNGLSDNSLVGCGWRGWWACGGVVYCRCPSALPQAHINCNRKGTSNPVQVDPSYILSEELAALTEDKCPEGAMSPGCAGLNKTPVCQAIKDNSIYGGACWLKIPKNPSRGFLLRWTSRRAKRVEQRKGWVGTPGRGRVHAAEHFCRHSLVTQDSMIISAPTPHRERRVLVFVGVLVGWQHC